MTAVLQVERFNLIGQFEGQDCEFRGKFLHWCRKVLYGKRINPRGRLEQAPFCVIDRSKHCSVYRGERDRVDAYARPRWWCCSPHQLTLPFTLPLSTTSSLELLIKYKTSVFRSSSHDLPTSPSSQRSVSMTTIEKQKHNRQRCTVECMLCYKCTSRNVVFCCLLVKTNNAFFSC